MKKRLRATLIFLSCTLVVQSAQASVEVGIYTVPNTTHRIILTDTPVNHLSVSQIAFVRYELDLMPPSTLMGLNEIDFMVSPLDIRGESASIIFPDSGVIYTDDSGFLGLFGQLRPVVGGNLYYQLADDEKQQLRDLFDAKTHHLGEDLMARTVGTWFAGWNNSSDVSLKRYFDALISSAETGKPLSAPSALNYFLTAASFYVQNGKIPFYTTNQDYVGTREFQAIEETDLWLRVGLYTLLRSGNQIIGMLDYRDGPTKGQPITFLTPIALPALAWERFASRKHPRPRVVPDGPQLQTGLLPSQGAPFSDVPTRAIYMGSDPTHYIPVTSSEGQKLSPKAPPHLVSKL